MYDTAEEAQQKLVNSVVFFDNQPVFISQAAGNKNKVELIFSFLPLRTSNNNPRDSVLIFDPRWNFWNLGSKLGYVNYENTNDKRITTVWSYRIPTRHSRQGLDNRTVHVRNFSEPGNIMDFSTLFYYSPLVDTLTNRFPSYKTAFNTILVNPNKQDSIAIHRKLMLVYDKVNPPNLVYRNERVGYTEDGLVFKLAKHKEFLKEELSDEMGLKIA